MLTDHYTATAGRAPCPRTPGPVGITVNVDALCPLERVRVDHPLVADEVSPHSLHGFLGRLRRRAHESTHLLGRELDVDPVLRKVIGSGCQRSELGVACNIEWLIILQLLNDWLESGRRRRRAAVVEPQSLKKSLTLSRISFLFDTTVGP